MRRGIEICLAGVLLASCGPLSLYYRPGVTVSRMQADTTECEVQAQKDAPVTNQIRQRPPVFVPGQRYCDAAGNCFARPGYWVDGGIYTVDTNRDLRARVLDMCMAGRGYQPVSIPPCSAAVARAAPATPTRTLPRLTEKSCVVRYDSGAWQIVTPVEAAPSE